MDIREVARRSGVSMATVSRAFNDRPDISRATREHVLAVARELGYAPDQQARTLVRRRSDLVGVIWDTTYLSTHGQHPFLQDLLVGLKIAFAAGGHHLMLLFTDDPDGDAYMRIARQYNLAGLVLMGVDERRPAITRLLASGRPCVAIDLPLRGPRAGFVTSDNRAGAAAAVDHLHALGHRRIATITGPPELLPGAERLAGYRERIAALGLPVREDYLVHGDFFLDSGRQCMRRLLTLADPPTAVFAAGDEMAIGAMDVIIDAGLRPGREVSVVGYDDVEAAALVRPTLTTVAQDRSELARTAAGLLAELIGDGEDGPDDASRPPRLVPNHLVVRGSSGPAPGQPRN